MFDVIKEYVHNHYPTKAALAGGIICAAAAVEMAILVPYHISQIHHAANGALEPLKYNLSASLGGAIFYGLCALNIIPRTAAVGASIFTLYSISNFQHEGAYLTSRLIGNTVKFITKEILSPICEHVLIPIIRKIAEVASKLIAFIGKLIVNMALPKHPVWIGVLILGSAIAIYQFVIPYFMTAKG